MIPLSLDSELWNPASVRPRTDLPIGKFTFLRYAVCLRKLLCCLNLLVCSVFKMEPRKGWDVLLRGYFEEFSQSTDSVQLVVHTYLYGESGRDARNPDLIRQRLESWAQRTLNRSLSELPPLVILSKELPEREMISLYKSADAFVLPTRGEGFCMPCLEALSMELPTIVTNYSGPTAFMGGRWSFPLSLDRLVQATPLDDWVGVRAEPSLSHLRTLMRLVYSEPEAAAAVGRLGREHVKLNFDNRIVAQRILQRLRSVKDDSS